MWEWGLDNLGESTELLVSELVTNAVQAMAGQADQPAFGLRLSADYSRVLIEVWDADVRTPIRKDSETDGMMDSEAEGGRGLILVSALSAHWGWNFTREPAGKVVWCELHAGPPESGKTHGSVAQPPLPQRIPYPVRIRPAAVMNDPDILRRLREGLRNLDRSQPA
jgi:hypothetical protein